MAKKSSCKTTFNVSYVLALYQQILNDEGDLHFKTDNRGLFAHSLERYVSIWNVFYKINLNLHQEDDRSNI